MKKIFTTACFLILCTLAFANPVDEGTAKAVALTFVNGHAGSQGIRNAASLELAYRADSKAANAASRMQPATYFYVFNISSAKGFVIVSGDDHVYPVLGYSDDNNFDAAHIPRNVGKWLEGYKSEIRYVIESHVPVTPDMAAQWKGLREGTFRPGAAARSTGSVSPLVQTKWNQDPNYNALCPGGSVTGCVATAMAQVMKFWNYPANGAGFHSFNHSKYGTLSANFGSTPYQWTAMPNSINGANSAIATLMYHCGVSVDMDYSPNTSSAYMIAADNPVSAENALKTYFGYKNTLQGVKRSAYTQAQWIALLKQEFDAKRPVLYAGFGNGGGHCFVADGYDNNDYIHFNWGWGGIYDGYFSVNAMNPEGVGAGGGTGGYNSGHQAVIGIQPGTNGNGNGGNGGNGNDNTAVSMSLYNSVTPSAATISYAQAFSISTNMVNRGAGNFSGDYAAAIFDKEGNFVDFVETKTGYALQSGYAYTSNLVFSSQGMLGMLPGKYFAGIFYRPAGGQWVLVANNGNYSNLVPLTVVHTNDIELNAAITVKPGTTLTKGQPASVTLNIVNKGGAVFSGQYEVGLYKLDGSFVQSLGSMSESDGLPSGYTYLSPYLTFSTTAVTADPGTYLLAVLHKAGNSASWQLTGSTNFQNPVKINVQAAALLSDKYEVNNKKEQAYTLPLNFTGNTATVSTSGAGSHSESDYDYYKIVLPAGGSYAIMPRLHDAYSSGNGNTYTLDALVSYSTDGVTWSDAFDDVVSEIDMKNGGTVYFMVAPYFTGETGTYQLDVSVTKSVVTGIEEELLLKTIRIYPNPSTDYVAIDLKNFIGKVRSVSVFNVQGQQVVSTISTRNETQLKIPVVNLAEGLYFLQMDSDKGLLTKKILVR